MWKYRSPFSYKFQLRCFAWFKFYLLVVLDIVHDLGDTSLMVLEEGGAHNWVQAVGENFQVVFQQKSCLSTQSSENFSVEKSSELPWIQRGFPT